MSSTSSQPQQNELRDRLNIFLKELPTPIENLKDNYERISYFVYFLTIKEGEGIALKSSILNIFLLSDIGKPTNIDRDLQKMKKNKLLVPQDEGFRLHRVQLNNIEDKLKVRKQNISLRKNLTDLTNKINDIIEKDFIEEAIRCFGTRPSSKRGTILLSWIAGVYHLQSYVLKNKQRLLDFNKALQNNAAKNKSIVITKAEDFYEINEDVFILKLRESSIVDKNIYKQLKEQLDLRNTCGHPNTISISDSKAEAFVEDVINNILLRYK